MTALRSSRSPRPRSVTPTKMPTCEAMTAGNATIRFYAELNDLLPSAQRQRDVPYRFGDTSSVKDAIESLGVPHTVVDLILANGTSVDLGYRLVDGDRISVYPVFERLDITDLIMVRSEPLRQVRFVAGPHLGTLVRRLRLLGLDACGCPKFGRGL